MNKFKIQELKDIREAAWNVYIAADDKGAEAAWKEYLVTRNALYNARGKTLSNCGIKKLKEVQDAAWTDLLNAQYKYKFTGHFVVTNSAFTESPEWENHVAAAKVASDAWTAYDMARDDYEVAENAYKAVCDTKEED